MPLVERTLFGVVDRVAKALDRLREFEPPDGYYLAFSGGKDSVVIKALANMAGVKYDAHYNVSGIDPPELVRFIREHHPDVTWDRADQPFFIKMRTWGFPLRQQKWCCKFYKEAGGSGRLVLTGVRWAESRQRSGRMMVERCYNDPSKTFLHVIIDWQSDEVWEFIKANEIPYCHLYDEGFKRLGCIGCPEAYWKQRLRQMTRWPRMEQAYRIAFRKLHTNRKAQGKPSVDRWADGDEMFDWWIRHDPPKTDENQMGLFA